jgi:hypothetical protein
MKSSPISPGFRADAVILTFLALTIAPLTPGCARYHPEAVYHEVYVSPDVKSHQGYATDGINHYTFDNQTIYKWKDDQDWTLLASNKAPFAGLSGINHFGDGDYFGGKLYIVAEFWADCAHYTNQSLLVFDAASLARLETHDVSAQQHEVSGLAVAPHDGRQGVIYVTSYCDGSKIFKYDLRTFQYLGSLALSTPLSSLQGVAWHNGRFYAPEDGGAIYTFAKDGQVSLIYRDSHSGSHEGLKYADGGLRWLIDEGRGKQRIHYISMKP